MYRQVVDRQRSGKVVFDCVDANSRTFAFIDIRGYSYSRNVSGSYTIAEVAAEQTRSRLPTC
jgi:hypothetical protein